MKVKQNKLTKMWEVITIDFGTVVANFQTRGEAIKFKKLYI